MNVYELGKAWIGVQVVVLIASLVYLITQQNLDSLSLVCDVVFMIPCGMIAEAIYIRYGGYPIPHSSGARKFLLVLYVAPAVIFLVGLYAVVYGYPYRHVLWMFAILPFEIGATSVELYMANRT